MTQPYSVAELMKIVDEIVDKWVSIVIPIFVESKKKPITAKAADVLGSAYLCSNGETFFLVTALHVVKDANEFQVQVTNINGTAIDIGGLKFQAHDKHDIAVTELKPEWFDKKEVEKVKAAPVGRDLSKWERTGIFIAMGYPATKNELDVRYGKVDRYCHSISLGLLKNCKIKTEVEDAIFLSYDHKNIIHSSGKKQSSQPDLYGMSGGPCLELLSRYEDFETKFSLEPVGVLVEWHKKSRVIVVAPLFAAFHL